MSFSTFLNPLVASALMLTGIAGSAQDSPDKAVASGSSQIQTQQPVATLHPAHEGRPRIGLVLEGGGALGFAHIGVIRWLEQNHIPVDYVAGTSMGALVGGLYAAGNRPDDIERIVDHIDWPTVLGGQVPFQALAFRRKEDKLAYPNRLDLGIKHGVSLPSGLNSGGGVSLVFTSSLLPYYNLKSFDDLPIPFRCVATEMVSGKAKVFDSGSLPQALRATMSIPAVFAPVKDGNEVYSDGGAVDNLPVDVARQMGADIVIAVYLDTGPITPASLKSIVGVAGRNVAIMVAANELRSMQDADVLVSADLAKVASTDFLKSSEIIPRGEEAAQKKATLLRKFAVSDAEWDAYLKERESKHRKFVPVPQFVEVDTPDPTLKREIADAFAPYQGKPIDTEKMKNTITEVEGTGYISTVDYSLQQRNGETGLTIRPQEKENAPPFLNVGFTLDGDDSNNIRFGFGGRITVANIVGPGSEWRTDLNVGLLAGVQSEIYRPFATSPKYFVAGRAYYTHSLVDLFNNGSQLAEYKRNQNGLGFDLGRSFGTRSQLRIGQDYQWYSVERTIGQDLQPEFRIKPGVTSVKYRYYDQDSSSLPFRGTLIEMDFNRYSQRPGNIAGGFQQIEGNIASFHPVIKNGSIFGRMQAGTSFGSKNLGLAGLSLGGPFRLSAYERYELFGSRYFLAQGGYEQRLFKMNPILGDAIYAVGFAEIGRIDVQGTGSSIPLDIAGALVTKTLLGPLYFGGSVGDSGHRKWFFGVNRIF